MLYTAIRKDLVKTTNNVKNVRVFTNEKNAIEYVYNIRDVADADAEFEIMKVDATILDCCVEFDDNIKMLLKKESRVFPLNVYFSINLKDSINIKPNCALRPNISYARLLVNNLMRLTCLEFEIVSCVVNKQNAAFVNTEKDDVLGKNDTYISIKDIDIFERIT